MRSVIWFVGVLGLSAGCSTSEKGFVEYNAAPSASITQPADGTPFPEGSSVQFVGLVSDDGAEDALQISWSSDIDGVLSEGQLADADGNLIFSTAALSVGLHTITLQATDGEALSGQDTVTVQIDDLPDAPVVTIVRPIAGQAGLQDEPFEFQAQVSDAQDAPSDLTVEVSSDLDGWLCDIAPDALGVGECLGTPITSGDHVLTFAATDLDGFTGEATIAWDVTPATESDDDGDGWTEAQGDCDDGDPTVNPDEDEFINGRDDDCNGLVDDETNAFDDDGDCYCEVGPCAGSIEPSCATVLDGDCDDTNDTINPEGVEWNNNEDDDCNGLIDDNTDDFDDDGDTFTENTGDCDDTDPSVNPLATEIPYDGIDQDCSGADLVDVDGDGFVADVVGGADCDDSQAQINPDATDIPYDGFDQDCSGDDLTDVDGDGHDCDCVPGGDDCDDADPDISPTTAEIPYDGVDQDCSGADLIDVDGDGYTADIVGGLDCDDMNGAVRPGAVEIPYDGIDQDCNGTDLVDVDGDGHACDCVGGTDCNDNTGAISPTVSETPYDGVDQNCDGADLTDVDGDGFDATFVGGTDCNDTNDTIFPGAAETPYDGIDQDCNGVDLTDVDGDGFPAVAAGGADCNDNNGSIYPGADEYCDGVDNNCASGVDEEGAVDCTVYWYDGDNDGYGTTASRCTCDPNDVSNYDANNPDDCYDANGSAYPGQTTFFVDDRGDGSHDYNCDGSESKYYTDTVTFSCNLTGFLGCCGCDWTSGWATGQPDCGETEDWYSGCYWIPSISCDENTTTPYTQSCR